MRGRGAYALVTRETTLVLSPFDHMALNYLLHDLVQIIEELLILQTCMAEHLSSFISQLIKTNYRNMSIEYTEFSANVLMIYMYMCA